MGPQTGGRQRLKSMAPKALSGWSRAGDWGLGHSCADTLPTLFFFFFKIGSNSVAQAGLKLMASLLLQRSQF